MFRHWSRGWEQLIGQFGFHLFGNRKIREAKILKSQRLLVLPPICALFSCIRFWVSSLWPTTCHLDLCCCPYFYHTPSPSPVWELWVAQWKEHGSRLTHLNTHPHWIWVFLGAGIVQSTWFRAVFCPHPNVGDKYKPTNKNRDNVLSGSDKW